MRPTPPIRVRPGAAGWLLIDLPYTPERVEKIKSISGRVWLDEHKCWAIKRTAHSIERLKGLFSDDRIVIAPEVYAPEPPHPGRRPAIRVTPGSGRDALHAFVEALKENAYSPHTIHIYALHIRRFLKAIRKSPQILEPDDIRAYLDRMVQNDVAETYRTQAVRALKTFLSLTLKKSQPFLRAAFPPRRKPPDA